MSTASGRSEISVEKNIQRITGASDDYLKQLSKDSNKANEKIHEVCEKINWASDICASTVRLINAKLSHYYVWTKLPTKR